MLEYLLFRAGFLYIERRNLCHLKFAKIISNILQQMIVKITAKYVRQFEIGRQAALLLFNWFQNQWP